MADWRWLPRIFVRFQFAGFDDIHGGFLANSNADSPAHDGVILCSANRFARGDSMRPRERCESGQNDLFRSRLDAIIDMKHALVRLAHAVDWRFLERTFGDVYRDGAGQPPLPTRLMAGLALLKHSYDLSDEALCERWVENPYFQYFCGEEFFQHRLPLDRSSMTNWRNRMGEERLQALLQESLAVATKTGAMKPSELSRVIVDTTVQPKNITFPTDAKLLNRAREKLVKLAKQQGVKLRQSYARVGKFVLIQHQRYAHAKQFKRANRALRTLKTYLGRIIRDISRKIEGDAGLDAKFASLQTTLSDEFPKLDVAFPESSMEISRSVPD